MVYPLLADAVLLVHLAVVVGVVGGLGAVVLGHHRGWRWVGARRFRQLHLLAIGFIAVQAWLGQHCPLTILESWLRVQGGEAGYTTHFIGHWVQRLLYHEAPLWVFAVLYTGFGGLVLLAWWRYPPRPADR